MTYLHLMPLFKMPEGENDGGYAVSSYREVQPPLGTMEQLAALAGYLRAAGISLVMDLVFNHTSDEHLWAEKAKAGEADFMEMYHIHPDRSMPDAYEQTLREIFPDEHPGAFSPFPRRMGMDRPSTNTSGNLDYANPAVFNRMTEEIPSPRQSRRGGGAPGCGSLHLETDGTNCENLPQAHTLIRAFNAAARIAAPRYCSSPRRLSTRMKSSNISILPNVHFPIIRF